MFFLPLGLIDIGARRLFGWEERQIIEGRVRDNVIRTGDGNPLLYCTRQQLLRGNVCPRQFQEGVVRILEGMGRPLNLIRVQTRDP